MRIGGGSSNYRWLVPALSWLAFTMTSVDRSTWGPAAVSIHSSLGVPLASLGLFATCYYIGYVVSNASGGFLADWIGGRAVLGVGSLGAGALMVAFGSTRSVGVGLGIQAVLGLFAGVDYAAGLKLIASWFRPSGRGLAMGVFMTATSAGTLIANAVVPQLIASGGWGESYRVFGGCTVVVGLLCLVLVRGGGGAALSAEGADGAVQAAGVAVRRVPDLRPLARNRDLALLGVAGFGGLWGTYGFVTWANLLMVKGSHLAAGRAGLVVVVFSGAALVAKPLVGVVTDRFGWGNRTPIAVIFLVFAAVLLWFGTLHSWTAFLWVAPLLGAAAYAYSPLTAAMIPNLSGDGLAGSGAGAVNAVWQLGSVAVPAVIGPVYQASGSFFAAFATLAAGPVLGAAVMLAVRSDRAVAARGGAAEIGASTASSAAAGS